MVRSAFQMSCRAGRRSNQIKSIDLLIYEIDESTIGVNQNCSSVI